MLICIDFLSWNWVSLLLMLYAGMLSCPCVSWDLNPALIPSRGTNLRGGTMCFVACQKQSPPAHYIYSTSRFHCCNTLRSERGGAEGWVALRGLWREIIIYENRFKKLVYTSTREVVRSYMHISDSSFFLEVLLSFFCEIKHAKQLYLGSPHLSSPVSRPTRPPCSVWALEVVSRGLCPVHWSWKKSVSRLVMEQVVLPLWSDGLGEQGEQDKHRAGPSPGDDQQWGSQCSFCVTAVGFVFGNYNLPFPLCENSLDFSRVYPDLTGSNECKTHSQQTLNS